MKLFLPLAGAVLIIFVARDIFYTLLHPSGSGSLSEMLPWLIWRVFRWLAKHCKAALPFAGPAAFVAVIASWIMVPALGWALIYWPYMQTDFIYASGLDPKVHGSFIDALYFSCVTLVTIGYGDIVPISGWLRMLAPLEGLLGFAVFTAAVSWLLSIYPVLSRRWSLAHQIALLQSAEDKIGISVLETDSKEQVLSDLTAQLTAIGNDLRQFPISYYFHSSNDQLALSKGMSYLMRLAQKGASQDRPPATQLTATMLHGAIEDFSSQLASHFLGFQAASINETLAAYARDHSHPPRGLR